MSNREECDASLHDEWKIRAKQAERDNETDEARCERCGAMSNSEEERDALIADRDAWKARAEAYWREREVAFVDCNKLRADLARAQGDRDEWLQAVIAEAVAAVEKGTRS